MTSAGRDTDERLRTYLVSQAEQERLCIGLVSLIGGFYNIAPRRPLGGPDGSRDIQAVAAGSDHETWFAAGFVHAANDSDEQRTQIIKKCRSDIDNAIGENPGLKAFGFFSNVDIKPSEERDLRAYAKTKGIGWFEVYNRERMRSLLDAPQGYGLRLEFLDIAMNKEQQLAWLATQHTRLEQVEALTRRMEIMLARQERLRTVSLVVKLRSGFDLSNHGPFAVSVQLGVSSFDGIQLLFGFGMKDGGPGAKVADTFVWRSPSADDEGSAWNTVVVPTDNAPHLFARGFVSQGLKELLTRHSIVNVCDLDALCAVLHMTEGLPQHIEEVHLYANSVLAMRAVPEQWNTVAGELKGHWPRWQGWDPRNWVRVQPSFIHFRFADLAFHNAWPLADLNSR